MPTTSGGTTVATPGLVGRDSELTMLADLVSEAGSGSPAVAVIRGESGSGKTHLLGALAERAGVDGWRCLHL